MREGGYPTPAQVLVPRAAGNRGTGRSAPCAPSLALTAGDRLRKPSFHARLSCKKRLIRLRNTAHQAPRPTKKQVLRRKAHRCDVRGAGLWPTGVLQPPGTELILRRVPWRTQRMRFRPLKAGSDAQGARSRSVHMAAYQVLPIKTRVLVRKAPGGDVYWSTLASRERSGRGSATH